MRKISVFFNDLNTTTRLFFLLLLVIIVGVIYYNFSSSLIEGIGISIITIILLWLTQNLWVPREYRRPIISNFTLGGFGISSLLIITNYNKVSPLLKPVFSFFIPFINTLLLKTNSFKEIKVTTELINTLMIVLLLLLFFAINHIFRTNTIVSPHPQKFKKNDFPELGFAKKLSSIGQSLEIELNKIDKETNWNDYYFIPIEAEVEIYHNDKKEKRITDLMNAL